MSFLKTSIALVTFAASIGSAHAGGLLADVFIRPISPAAADAADAVHAAAGNPLDVAAQQAAQQLIQQLPPILGR